MQYGTNFTILCATRGGLGARMRLHKKELNIEQEKPDEGVNLNEDFIAQQTALRHMVYICEEERDGFRKISETTIYAYGICHFS